MNYPHTLVEEKIKREGDRNVYDNGVGTTLDVSEYRPCVGTRRDGFQPAATKPRWPGRRSDQEGYRGSSPAQALLGSPSVNMPGGGTHLLQQTAGGSRNTIDAFKGAALYPTPANTGSGVFNFHCKNTPKVLMYMTAPSKYETTV